jgi:hypothetical protein
MDAGGSIFTQVSRFLDEGGILQKFAQVETAGDIYEEPVFNDRFQKRQSRNREFFESIDDYFRSEDNQ